MSTCSDALIIAAGRGERFGPQTQDRPKPMLEVGGVPLICRTILTAWEAGMRRFTVVTGYGALVIEEFLRRDIFPPGVRIRFLRNEDWQRPNGRSVLLAREALKGPFALLMADHLFDARILEKLLELPLPGDSCRLAVDFRVQAVPDLEDATKVSVRDGRVTAIGKRLTAYNAVDTGVFLCSPTLFDALQNALFQGGESLSDGVREVAQAGRMEAMDIGDLFWHDVDDEVARLEGERRLRLVR